MGSNEILQGNVNEDVELLNGQSEVFKNLFAYADTLVLRSVVELRIADIIHSHGQPMSLSQIASKIESPSSSSSFDVMRLARVMQMLVRKNIFTVDYNHSLSSLEEVDTAVYGLTTTSKWLLHDHELSLAPMFLTYSHPLIMASWYHISPSIIEGGSNPFIKAHGKSFWEMTSKNPEFNKIANDGMAAASRPTLDAVVKVYADGFSKMEGTLVDVGGGAGWLMANIVKAYPHIKGINFDMPHVVADAPLHFGVTHVGGDMFKEIPVADNVIIKSVLHNWGNEECVTILRNCKKAISQSKGKVIIVDVILHLDRHGMADDAAIAVDLWLMTSLDAGKERTENEWKKLLNKAGFTNLNIIPIQAVLPFSIIEAFY